MCESGPDVLVGMPLYARCLVEVDRKTVEGNRKG
ncbi:uncharacterized protein FRV6_08135 [Fusarium oxysporum]|uniref:Uncharacterized protein n=1 Tax=Fusarium oxysporum TaxID=5507 RepID=A0A2H3T5J6_FUSOX|nr:uncharacterized protein FRV6_08135 [Fusarium oxysporum]